MPRNDVLKVVPAAIVNAVSPYRPPRHLAPVELDLSANEGAVPDAALFSDIALDGVRRYPKDEALRKALAERVGVAADRLVVTAGADDALARAIRSVGAPGREIILPMPTFEMLPRYVSLASATAVTIDWSGADFPEEQVCAAISDKTAAIVVVSPNNPTGAVISKEALVRLAEKAPHALLIVDLAYGEFADVDLTDAALSHPNALVVRTLSKAWGLAGLRVGYAISDPQVIGWLESVGQPFSVSGPALQIALRAVAQQQAVDEFVSAVRQERGRISQQLLRYGIETSQSQANFVYAETPRAGWIADGLAGCGIRIRRFMREGKCFAMRISCPGNESNLQRLLGGLELALDPDGVLIAESATESRVWPAFKITDSVRALSEQAAARLPCAVVGGARPSSPAAVPARPTISSALEEMGTDRAWMFCAKPAEVKAAREANVLPIGVAKGQSREAAGLLEAGASRVIADASELGELFDVRK
jgi:histidinol-phosphate aminotransferase